MSRHPRPGPARGGRNHPMNAWYVLATSDEVAGSPIGRRALDTGVVLFRTTDGTAVALEDRCAHRPYPLSLGRVDGDCIVSGYSGFVYDRHGVCVHVPTQAEVPLGARVRAFPVVEDSTFIWVWLGEPSLARLRPPPRTPWLRDPAWVTVGDAWDTDADVLLLHENFADITHVAVVDPFIAPPVLRGPPPPLEVEVTETGVSFSRTYAPAPIAGWHADLLGVTPHSEHVQREQGRFVSPGLWVDGWDVDLAGRSSGGPSSGGPSSGGPSSGEIRTATFRFTHAVTPVTAGRTRHVWRVSRNFALDDEASAALVPIFSAYYRRVQGILQTMQDVLDGEGYRPEVHVSADAAVLQVRKIIRNMVADESGTSVRRLRDGRPPSSAPAPR
jgi:phenylpropionate dioxygenase-like ring-hydroxylating dioxygenase large terminal subunit